MPRLLCGHVHSGEPAVEGASIFVDFGSGAASLHILTSYSSTSSSCDWQASSYSSIVDGLGLSANNGKWSLIVICNSCATCPWSIRIARSETWRESSSACSRVYVKLCVLSFVDCCVSMCLAGREPPPLPPSIDRVLHGSVQPAAVVVGDRDRTAHPGRPPHHVAVCDRGAASTP